jgi:hypothetical protein
MHIILLTLLFVLLPCSAQAGDLSLACQGQTRFVHRGAPSTYPAEEKRSFHFEQNRLDGMPCEATATGMACFGLTQHQAMRRVTVDLHEKLISDTLELPTSQLIFEGRCD